MKTMRFFVLFSFVATMAYECTNPFHSTDSIKGTYYGTLTNDTFDTTTSCVIEKIKNHTVKITGPARGGNGYK